MRQAQDDERGRRRAGVACRGKHRFELAVDEEWNQRCHQHAGRYAGGRQSANGFDPPRRCRGAWFESAGELGVELRYRNEDASEPLRGRGCDQVEIPFDQCPLGGDGEWVPAIGEHREHGARDA